MEAKFVIMPSPGDMAVNRIAIGVCSPVYPIPIDDYQLVLQFMDEHAPFQIPVGPSCNTDRGGSIVTDQSGNSMDFTPKSRGIVFVSGQREMSGIRWLLGAISLVGSPFQGSLGGSVIGFDLDFLQTKNLWPTVAPEKQSQWAHSSRLKDQLFLEQRTDAIDIPTEDSKEPLIRVTSAIFPGGTWQPRGSDHVFRCLCELSAQRGRTD